jgi:hypothetical protein
MLQQSEQFLQTQQLIVQPRRHLLHQQQLMIAVEQL